MGQNIAFINLPYFARQEVLKQEVSNLLMTLMNVYALIIVISILVILFVSNYVSRPLAILKKHMQEVRLGKKNQKIEWKGIEEINTLVDEYNIMIDALEVSSDKLAKSERESAWREMAKQVAHEIKNPLTPMKLSVQYMMRAYGENTEDQKERIQSLSNTLIEQIDTLADIATAFSNFADMPKSSMVRQEINSVIRTATELYDERENVSIFLNCNKQYYLNIDKSQWIRVFNNLIKNSIQATNDSGNIEIRISMEQKADKLIIQFQDNGKGIPIEMQSMIFTPKFTTKTQGAGLGLAMVKSIVSNSNGDIRLDVSNENGSVFVIEMPIE
jgi:nitrogen fixation/metabolism regulation signal transduction histidine kinase